MVKTDEDILGVSEYTFYRNMQNIPECIMVEEIRRVVLEDDHSSTLSPCMINGWLSVRAEVIKVHPYWFFRYENS